jgi:DNA-binding GntR family transcriptional regulator
VSRIPVREALRRLEAEGLVVVYPNRGAFVSRLDAAELEEIYDLRVMLECDLLERAVATCSAEDVLAMRHSLALAETGASGPQWSERDDEFHAALYVPARRPRQLAMVMTLRGAVRHYQYAHATLPRNRERWLRDHRAILAACERRDAGAARERLASHLRRAARHVIATASSAN